MAGAEGVIFHHVHWIREAINGDDRIALDRLLRKLCKLIVAFPSEVLQLKGDDFKRITILYEHLLTVVDECCKHQISLGKQLNCSLAGFCIDLLSVVEPSQVFELFSLYLGKISGMCQSMLHDCKLKYLEILFDHDPFVEMLRRNPSDRNGCTIQSILGKDIVFSSQRNEAKMLLVLMSKHEFDTRHQKPEDKLYIAQLCSPFIIQILDCMPVFLNLSSVEKREVSIVALKIIRNIDDASLMKVWMGSMLRTRSFFQLLEECLTLFEDIIHAQSSTTGAQALRESPHPTLIQNPERRREYFSSVAVNLLVLEVTEIFSVCAAKRTIVTDYGKLDCITSIFIRIFSTNQALDFWKTFFPVFNNVFNRHGATLFARENDGFIEQIAFHLLHLGVNEDDDVRKRAVVGLQILVRSSFCNYIQTWRLRVMLMTSLSKLLDSNIEMVQTKPDETREESGAAVRLKKSLKEMADEIESLNLLKECGLPESTLVAISENSSENQWSWSQVKRLSDRLILALDARREHALIPEINADSDRYAAAFSFYRLAKAFSPVSGLRIEWLQKLGDAHKNNQLWAEAAQCNVACAGIIMQAHVRRNNGVWSKDHVSALRRICPMVAPWFSSEAFAAEVEGNGRSGQSVYSAVEYLMEAVNLFAQAELYHICASTLELVIPLYKSKRANGQLAECHTLLSKLYKCIAQREASPIPIVDATYYRVGFYGSKFGTLHGNQYIFRFDHQEPIDAFRPSVEDQEEAMRAPTEGVITRARARKIANAVNIIIHRVRAREGLNDSSDENAFCLSSLQQRPRIALSVRLLSTIR